MTRNHWRRACAPAACGLVVAVLAAAEVVFAAPGDAGGDSRGAALALGAQLDLPLPGEPPMVDPALRGPLREGPPVAGPFALLEARWEVVHAAPDAPSWSAVAAAAAVLRRAGYRVVLTLGGTPPAWLGASDVPGPATPAALEAWLAFCRSGVRTLGSDVAVWVVGDRPWDGYEPAAYAFLLKQTALALRAEAAARATTMRVAQAAADPERLDWQRGLWEADAAAYVDVFPIRLPPDAAALPARLSAVFTESLAHPPVAERWALIAPDGGDGSASAAAAVTALASGARVALVESTPPVGLELLRWIAGLHEHLADGYAPASDLPVVLETAQGAADGRGTVLGRFLRERDFTNLVVYQLSGSAMEPGGQLAITTSSLREARWIDPLARVEQPLASPRAGGRPDVRVLAVPPGRWPQLVVFRRALGLPGLELPPESLDVAATRGLTAEEIIARHQEVQRIQDDRLERWTARGRVDLHFRLGQSGSSFDLTIESNYFWERGAPLEWEQTDYYVNGNRLGWKKIPELPLIQPEKVVTLPLDLTLDRTYVYRLAGTERVDGREAWVLEFQPADPDAPSSLYRGRVWIDRESFERVKTSVLQTRLDAPVLSNEEIDTWGAIEDGEGRTFRMLSRVEGQQVWNAAGRTLPVQRELTFREVRINPERAEFERARLAAYTSPNQMLRDTDEGFRYLERQPDGGRTVKQEVDTGKFLAGAGAFRDSSTDGVQPLAAVNYFNYDLFGRKIQFEGLFAGVFGFATASRPDLGPWHVDLSADLALLAIDLEDRVFAADREVPEERLDERTQWGALRLGLPLGQFFKLDGLIGAALRQYSANEDAESALDRFNEEDSARRLEFRLPSDHVQLTGGVELEFNRRGWSARASYTRARRSDWESWGLFDEISESFGHFDPNSGAFVPEPPEPLRDEFTRWGASAFREWFLPRFQKIRAEIGYLDGDDLDRFSRYQFRYFGDQRLDGFSGTGVRFDRALIARAGYSFNLLEVVRFDASLGNARVEGPGSTERQSFTGAGLSANFIGPWRTVIAASYGRAVAADVPELEGEQEFLLLVLKLF